ncbi:MAG: hypothetical protein U0821_25510 [Chloroflexota bacterium]
MTAVFQANYFILASISGQAFFIIGLLAGWEFRRFGRVPLARSLWMLAAFGFLYAFAEWGRVFIPIQQTYISPEAANTLWLARAAVLAASFAGLLQFGIELLPTRSRRTLRAAPPVLFAIAAGVIIGWANESRDIQLSLAMAETVARVLLAFWGSVACAIGLWLQAHFLAAVGGPTLVRWFRLAAILALVNAVTLGLMVPPMGSWPGTDNLLGVPAEVLRGLVGLMFALAIAQSMRVFQVESERALEDAESEAIRARARDELGKEISDRVAQHLYAAGLLLGEVVQSTPPDHPARRALAELDRSVDELRDFMLGKSSPNGEHPVDVGPAPTPESRRRTGFSA